MLTDTDVRVEFQTFYWSVVNTGIAFRAQDSVRFYCVVFRDMERKGSKYEARLFRQEESGYRREIATGFAPHSPLPEQWVQRAPKPEDWEKATPGWIKARVLAQGDVIRVFINDQQIIQAQDSAYPAGLAGLAARDPYLLRHSSGALVMGSRGYGIFMKTSLDNGRTWTLETRISHCSGMMGMTEMNDGRILVVFHEAYRTPTRVRLQYMRIAEDGTLVPA